MSTKYLGKYRNESTRLQGYDYGCPGYYFITICTKDRIKYFGHVENGKMILNSVGEIAYKFWMEIPSHFENVGLDEFVVMPDHIHGIIVINGFGGILNVGTLQCNVRTGLSNPPNPSDPTKFYSQISPKSGSLPTIIRSFKSICTKTINRINPKIMFGWQARYYDHIIQNDMALHMIHEYVRQNPANFSTNHKS